MSRFTRIFHTPNVLNHCRPVAQAFSLLYRRLPVGSLLESAKALHLNNLRYSRLQSLRSGARCEMCGCSCNGNRLGWQPRLNMVTGLNHLTFGVRDLERSVAFYSELLGFRVRMRGPSSAYLEAGTLWLALVVDLEARRDPLPEYSHVAFTVAPAAFATVTSALRNAGARCWQVSDHSDSFYFLDPDNHKLELHTGDLRRRLDKRLESGCSEVQVYE